jgi:hypothetical protein
VQTTPRMEQQVEFPFGAAEGDHQNNLTLIKLLYDNCRKTHGIKSRHADLLHWIENFHGRDGKPLRKTLNELGQRRVKGFGLSCSEATAQRIVDRLEALGILIVDRGSNGDHGRRPNCYSIHWPAVVRVIQEAKSTNPQDDFANPHFEFRKPAI